MSPKLRKAILRQIGLQAFLLLVTAVVMFPVLWVVSMALDPRNISRPNELQLIPPGASLESFRVILFEPFGLTREGIYFGTLLKNSLVVSLGTAVMTVALGASAAYAFSRFRFIGRQVGMLSFIILLMMPSTGTMVPLFVLMSRIEIGGEQLRRTLFGLMIAYASSALPFAIWNLKGYFDTIPKELEEAALIDGASLTGAFFRVILPLSLPALAVTILFSFMSGWTEFMMAWVFLEDPERTTLAMALRSISGGGQHSAPWSEFAAMSILMSLPVLVLFFLFQRWIVSGLTVGGVKG